MEEDQDLEKKFSKYCIFMEELYKIKNINISNDDKLYLYANYKQVLYGNNTKKEPSIINVIEYQKWKAYKSLENCSKNNAMKNYIRKVKEINKKK
jgi:diazepam-binding inhibitor (GABA receptor modulating acyl-CoA-binding protein)